MSKNCKKTVDNVENSKKQSKFTETAQNYVKLSANT